MASRFPFGGVVKYDQCEAGLHGECERPIAKESYQDGRRPIVVLSRAEGEELGPVCCCVGLGLWFDRKGVERWPDGSMYNVRRCQGCEDAPIGQHTGPHDWEHPGAGVVRYCASWSGRKPGVDNLALLCPGQDFPSGSHALSPNPTCHALLVYVREES